MEEINFIDTIIPNVGKTRIKFYGIDSQIFNIYKALKEFERQKNIKHLGIIAYVNDGANHTRFDYLASQCAYVDILENLNKGTQNIQLGSIKINKKEVKGNSLLKSWFLFSNLGHCYNTFSDEKALLMYAFSNKDFRRELINTIKDHDLKKWSKEIIMNLEYSKFHYILSLYRIYKYRFNQHNTEDIINPLKILLIADYSKLISNNNKFKQLIHIYKTIRMLSIISLDSQYSHIPFSVNTFSSIVSLSRWENYYSDEHFIHHLEPFYNMLKNEIYLNENILAHEKNYEVKATSKIQEIVASQGCEELVIRSLKNGLLNIPYITNSYEHFIRIPLLDKTKSVKSHILEIGKEFSEINQLHFKVESNTYDDLLFVDFIINKSIDDSDFAKCYYKICNFIKSQIKFLIDKTELEFEKKFSKIRELMIDEKQLNSFNEKLKEIVREKVIEDSNEKLFPMYKALLWNTIKYYVKDDYTFDIVQNNGNYNCFSMKFDILNSFEKNIKLAIKSEKDDEDRLNEIEQIYQSSKYKKDGYIFCCLNRIDVYNLLNPPDKAKCTDIDGVLIHSKEDCLIIEFHESKNTKKPFKEAKKDLNEKFIKILNNRKNGYRIKEVKGYGAKLVLKKSR